MTQLGVCVAETNRRLEQEFVNRHHSRKTEVLVQAQMDTLKALLVEGRILSSCVFRNWAKGAAYDLPLGGGHGQVVPFKVGCALILPLILDGYVATPFYLVLLSGSHS